MNSTPDRSAPNNILPEAHPSGYVQPESNLGPDVATDTTVESAVDIRATPEQSKSLRWAKRVALGAIAVGSAFVLAKNGDSMNELANQVWESGKDAAPYAGGAIALTETMWIGGAAMMLAGVGKHIPFKNWKRYFKLHEEFDDISETVQHSSKDMLNSRLLRTGLAVNTLGAVGTAATVGVAAVTTLPKELWPGAVGVAALDVAATVGLRAPLQSAIHSARNETKAEREAKVVSVRFATEADIDRLADIDLIQFDGAYGQKAPTKDEVKEMLSARLKNCSWMLVAEQGGVINGFVSGFRTDKAIEDFRSWEDTTANGTLDGRVNPEGKYVYVPNLTILPGVEGAKDMLLTRLIAEVVKQGDVEYGYFQSRMPQFRTWLEGEGYLVSDELTIPKEQLNELAIAYSNLRTEDGKRYDWMLRMYESDGFDIGIPKAESFEDAASMNYGPVCRMYAPGRNWFFKNIPGSRWLYGRAIHEVAKHPKLLKKVFEAL